MKQIKFLLFALFAILLFSCSAEEDSFKVDEIVAGLSEVPDIENVDSLNNVIIPIEGDRDTLQRPISTRAAYEIREEINQLDGIPFYLQVQGNSTTKQFLNAASAGTEVTVANYAGNTDQQFYIRILPATSGIPYLIYSKRTETPIRLGVYTNNPNVKILYADYTGTTGLFGASWDFRKGVYTPNSFILENQDSPQQGSSGNWWDIYYPVVTVNDAKVSFSQYNNSPRQEFAIVPAETFRIEEIRYNIDASAVLTKMPNVVFSDGYTNRGPIEQSHSFTISETYKETSTYNKKTSYSVNLSTKVSAKVPFVDISSEISTSITSGEEYTYGESEEKTFSISRTYPVVVPANHRAELTLTLFKYNIDVEYVAVCRGLTSGKRINIKGRWNGVDFVETDAVLDLFPINGVGARSRMVITKEMLKTNNLIRVK